VGKHLHVASRTETAEENAFRHDLARQTKIFRLKQKIFTQTLKIFILHRIKFPGGQFFLTELWNKNVMGHSPVGIKRKSSLAKSVQYLLIFTHLTRLTFLNKCVYPSLREN